jgi:hypothetical protein
LLKSRGQGAGLSESLGKLPWIETFDGYRKRLLAHNATGPTTHLIRPFISGQSVRDRTDFPEDWELAPLKKVQGNGAERSIWLRSFRRTARNQNLE